MDKRPQQRLKEGRIKSVLFIAVLVCLFMIIISHCIFVTPRLDSWTSKQGTIEQVKISLVPQQDRKEKQTPPSATSERSYNKKYVPIYAPPNEAVLALISPPGLISGYRNQMMRFIAFVTHAMENNIKYILLNSLVHATHDVADVADLQLLPFASLFDIDHWNSFHGNLPQLVDYHESSNYHCWKIGDDEETTKYINERPNMSGARKDLLRLGNFPQLFNTSKPIFSGEESFHITKARQLSLNLTHMANECKGNPVPYGGGDMAMELWDSARKYTDLAKLNNGKWPFDILTSFHKALRPNQKWRDVIKSCISNSAETTKYLGVHLRVELDMIGHPCGISNERNVTKIFADIDEFLDIYHRKHTNMLMNTISIATYRKKMEERGTKRYNENKALAKENLFMLNNLTKWYDTHRFGGQDVSVVECGKPHVDNYLSSHLDEMKYDYGVLLPQFLNFEMLAEADLFIGVRGSTFSEDVWITRYHRGKGLQNFEYTKNGILPIGNGGMPEPFDCWRK